VRSTLASREDGIVDALLNVRLLVLAEEDETSTGTTKCLVAVSDRGPVQLANFQKRLLKNSRGGADDIAVLERIILNLSSDETRDVGHVHHEVRTVEVSDLAKTLVVPVSRVSGGTTDQDPGLEEESVLLKGVVVDETGSGVDLVREGLEVD